jgi:hypothetical protein
LYKSLRETGKSSLHVHLPIIILLCAKSHPNLSRNVGGIALTRKSKQPASQPHHTIICPVFNGRITINTTPQNIPPTDKMTLLHSTTVQEYSHHLKCDVRLFHTKCFLVILLCKK